MTRSWNSGVIKRGQSILIHAASGGVGSVAVQLAKWKGTTVFATSSGKNSAFVRSLEADEVIAYRSVRFQDVVKDVDVVFVTIGDDVQENSWSGLKQGGILVSVVHPPDEKRAKEAGAVGKFVFIQPDAGILRELACLIDSGIIRPIVSAEFSLQEISRAPKLSESGRARGKIVIHVGTR